MEYVKYFGIYNFVEKIKIHELNSTLQESSPAKRRARIKELDSH
jgi:hypothetical protein